MKAKRTHKPTITIGIPSYELGESLVSTLNGIYRLLPGSNVKEVILISDGRKVSTSLRRLIAHPRLRIIEGQRRQGQSQRINDLCKAVTTDYLVLTNDDIIFDDKALIKINQGLKRPADLYTTTVKELPVRTRFEGIISVSVHLSRTISQLHNNFQNYLSCNGRLIILSFALAKAIHIPKKLWNNDAFIYLFTRVNGFTHRHLPQVYASYRLPDNISEYNRQGLKFRLSQTENQRYFQVDLTPYYALPVNVVIRALLLTIWRQPLTTILYLKTQILVKFWNMFIRSPYKIEQTFWQTDKSTKRIQV